MRVSVRGFRVRVSVVEPGIVETEVQTHLRPEVRETVAKQTSGVEKLLPQDVADAVAYVVTRDRRVAINEVLVRPTKQQR